MWSSGAGSNNNGNSNQWNQWSFNPNNYTHLAPDQVDWAALAQQWIQMKETQPPPPQQFSEHLYINAPQFPGPPVAQPAPTQGFRIENHGTPQPDPWAVAIQQQQPPIPDAPVKEEWSNSLESFPQIDYGFQGTFPPPPSQHHPPPHHHHHHHHHHHPEEPPNSFWNNNQQSSGPQVAVNKKLNAQVKNEFVRHQPHQHQHHQHSHEQESSRTTHELDAIRRKSLPAWIREGLEKVEREKRKKQEKEEQESLKAQMLEEEKARLAEVNASDNHLHTKWAVPESVDTVPGEDEKDQDTVEKIVDRQESIGERIHSFLVYLNKDENFDQLMLCVRRQLTTILLDGTNEMMSLIAQEMIEKYKRKALQVKKSKAVASLKSELGGFGLTSYGGSDSEESNESDSDSPDRGKDSDSDSESDILDEIKTKKQKFMYDIQLRSLGSEMRSPELAEVNKTDSVKETSGDNNKVHEKEPSLQSDEEYPEDRESLVDLRSESPDVSRDKSKNVSKSPSTSPQRVLSRSPSRSRSRSDSHDRTKRAKKSRSRSRERKVSSKVPRSRSRTRKRSKKSKSRSKSREKRRSKERRSRSREHKRSKKSRSISRDRRRSKRSKSKSVDRKKSRKSRSRSKSREGRNSKRSRSSSRSHKRHGKKSRSRSRSRSRERRVSKRSRTNSRERRRIRKSNSKSKSRERERRNSKRSRSSSKSRGDRRKNNKKSRSRSRSRDRQREHKSLKISKSRDKKKTRKSRSRSESSERKSKYDTN